MRCDDGAGCPAAIGVGIVFAMFSVSYAIAALSGLDKASECGKAERQHRDWLDANRDHVPGTRS